MRRTVPSTTIAMSGGGSPDAPTIVLERIVDDRAFTRSGRKVVAWLTGSSESTTLLYRPYGVAWRGDRLVVTDPGAGRVLGVDPRGRVRISEPSVFEQPIGVAACAAGIVVTDSKRGTVTLLDDELRTTRVVLDGLARPTGIACREGRVLVTETGRHRIVVVGLGGGERPSEVSERDVAFWGARGDGAGEFNFPTAVAVDGDRVWVGDTLNFRVQRLRGSDGAAGTVFGRLGDAPGEMPRLKGLAVDVLGNLWISDAHLDRVAVYSPDGSFLADLGGPGDEPGRFSFPAGVASDRRGRIAVVDSMNRRVQIFRVTGPGAAPTRGSS